MFSLLLKDLILIFISFKKSSNLNVSHFEKYFKAISNPDSVFFQPDDDAVEFNER